MADKKISALTAATTPLAGTEVLPIVQGGSTVKVSIANVTAGRTVSTGALSVVGANITLDNAFSLAGKLAAGTAVTMMRRSSGDEVLIDEDGYGAKIGFGGRYNFAGGGDFTVGIGNVIIGTAGKGIDFSANTHAAGMTSELLNDYEEGTWTPTISSAAGVVTLVDASSSRYTKIGRYVYVIARIGMTTDASVGTSDLTISGLPYAVSTSGFGNLSLSNFSSSDFGTGGAHGIVRAVGSDILHTNRTVDISGRGSTFYWAYNAVYEV
jgi:hypothetical protein